MISRHRSLVVFLVSAVLLVLAAAARADIVILKGNDIPLTGKIIFENDEELHIQIKGLGEDDALVVRKDRVRSYWREANSYWDYIAAEKKRRETLDRLKQKPESGGSAETAPSPAANPARSGNEIRRDLVNRAFHRTMSVVPDNPVLRLLLFVGVLMGASLLLYVGSRVADLPQLKFGKATLLAMITTFFVVLAVFSPDRLVRREALPLLVTGEVLAWILVTRVLAGGTVSKAVLLLSFFLAALFVLGGSAFSVLTAI